jgi:hypothetical protein
VVAPFFTVQGANQFGQDRQSSSMFGRTTAVPLAIGIYGEMLAVPRPPQASVAWVKAFLTGWTAMPQYLRAVAEEGSRRCHADGSDAGPVNERDRLRARLRLQLAAEDTELLGAVDGDRFTQHLVLRQLGLEEFVPPEPEDQVPAEADQYRIDRHTGAVFRQIPYEPLPWPPDLNSERSPLDPTERLIKTRRKPKPKEVKRLLTPPPVDDDDDEWLKGKPGPMIIGGIITGLIAMIQKTEMELLRGLEALLIVKGIKGTDQWEDFINRY